MALKNELRNRERTERLVTEGPGEWLALILNEGAKPLRKQGTGAYGTWLGKKMLSNRELTQITGLIGLLKSESPATQDVARRANRLAARFAFKFVIYPRRGRLPLVRPYPLKKSDYAAHAILDVLTLAESFQLNRLRRCIGCDKWIFVKGKQIACSPACYRECFYKLPEQRERRAKYMREYRQIQAMEGVK